MGERWRFKIEQDGMVVAGGEAGRQAAAASEAAHYAMVYGQDGPVKVSIWPVKTRDDPPASQVEGGDE